MHKQKQRDRLLRELDSLLQKLPTPLLMRVIRFVEDLIVIEDVNNSKRS